MGQGPGIFTPRFAPSCQETGETTKSLEYGKCLETGEATKFLKYGRGLSMESVKKRKIPCVIEKCHRHRAPNDLLDV